VFVFLLAGLYDRQTIVFQVRMTEQILFAQAVNIGLAAIFFFLIPYFGVTPKTVLAIYLVISSALILIWRIALYQRLPTLRRDDAILIGGGEEARQLVQEFARWSRYPLAFVDVIDTATVPPAAVEERLREALQRSPDISTIVADTADPVTISTLPVLYDVAFRSHRFAMTDMSDLYQDVFERVPLSRLRYDWILSRLGRPVLYDLVKRLIDILGGGIGCVLLAVAFPFIAVAVKLEGGGPVIIAQDRVGRHLRPIRIFKFRSMTGSDRGDEAVKTRQRVTRVGRLMRRVHLDETPQFWNVLRGDLSLVGPRPELPALVQHYAERIPYYHARHLVKPGMTGWARVRHRLDPHHGTDVAETKSKLAYDLYYLSRRSLVFDAYIILRTISEVVTARGK
jgi:lipopolysaccharide/colanic/teichoic acid biosynthesis glycosyltransferase